LFADPSFPPPIESGYDSRRHPWVGLPGSVHRDARELWQPMRPLYDAGRYAEAANRGRELIDAHPDEGYLYYNVACCESLAGRTADAVEHLRRAIDMMGGLSRACERRHRLRPDPQRSRFPGSGRPLAASPNLPVAARRDHVSRLLRGESGGHVPAPRSSWSMRGAPPIQRFRRNWNVAGAGSALIASRVAKGRGGSSEGTTRAERVLPELAHQ
jgi:hypothetical protein